MLRSALRSSRRLCAPTRLSARPLSTSSLADKKVTVVGAAGGIGQPLSLLLKAQPTIGELALFDIAPVTKGVAADLSHIPSPAKVSGYVGAEELEASLQDADVVVIPAGVPRKPGMTRDDLFNMNASIVANTIQACANVCPEASLCIISNPVNSTVPIAAEVLKKNGVYNPTKLFGVTTLDVCRAETFFAESAGIPVDDVINEIDVIGGHAGKTILPLFSKVAAEYDYDETKIEALTNRTMFGGDEVVQAKDGAGSATLSMALAGARFTENVLAGLNGEKRRVVAFVDNAAAPTDFFSSPFVLGPDGAENFDDFPLQGLSPYEEKVLAEMLPELEAQIKKGVDFVAKME